MAEQPEINPDDRIIVREGDYALGIHIPGLAKREVGPFDAFLLGAFLKAAAERVLRQDPIAKIEKPNAAHS